MKRFLLLTMMCLLGLFTVNAQGNLTIVELGADKDPDYDNYYLPVFDAANYAFSQQIYKAEEMGENTGSILTVGFKLGNETPEQTRIYEVYLKSTELNEFDETHYIDLNADDKVFDGEVVISGEMDSWFTITLDKAFNYTGGNILLAVYDKTGTSASPYHYFYKYSTTGRALYSKGNYSYDMLNQERGLKRESVSLVRFGMVTEQTVVAAVESVALGDVKVGNYWAEESAVKSAIFKVQVFETTLTSISCDNDFFTLNYNLKANPVTVKVGYDKTADAGDQTATITIKANDVEDITIPVTATAYTPVTPDVYELAQEIEFVANAFSDTPEFSNLNDDYNLPNEVNKGNTPDAVYAFELEEEHTVIVNVDGENAVAAIYSEDFAGEGGPKEDNSHKGIIPAQTTFSFDFNDGSLDAFNLRDDDGDGNNWGIVNGKLMSSSWISGGGNLTPDNYVFTKEAYAITATSKLIYKVNAVADNNDYYAVVVSEDGKKFDVVTEEYCSSSSQKSVEVDLSAYAGKTLHIGFRHFNCTGQYYIAVDDVQLTDGSGMVRGTRAESQIKVSYPAGKYYLLVAAEDQFTVNVSLDIAPPAIPETLVATPVDEKSIALSWTAVAEADSYNIYKGETLLTTVSADVTSYTVGQLQPNEVYCFTVTAVNKGIESFHTKPACATTKDKDITAPTNVLVTAIDPYSVKLTWDAVEYAQSYNVYIEGTLVKNMTERVYVLEDLEPSQQYCFSVSALRNGKETEKVEACGSTEAINFNDENLAKEFFFDFNDQSLDEFRMIDADGDGNEWVVSPQQNGYDDTYAIRSYSFYNVELRPNNYIYTKRPYRIVESSTVTMNVMCGNGQEGDLGEHYAVVVSENGTDWEIVFEETIDSIGWRNTTVSLEKYAGKGVLVGIRHYNCTGLYFLAVDNFALKEKSQTPITPDTPDTPDNPDNPGTPEVPEMPTIPAAPVVTAQATSASTIVLTWAAVEGATSYNIYGDTAVIAKEVTATTYTVTALTANTSYCYKLTAVNAAGESFKSDKACATTYGEGIEENTASFNIYPNPVNDKLYIETEVEVREVVIYDVYGRQQPTANSQQPTVIDVTNLNSGIYFVKVVTDNGEVVKRFVKK